MKNVEQHLKKDITYLDIVSKKNKYKSIKIQDRYQNRSNVYDAVRYECVKILNETEIYNIVSYIKVFNMSSDKTYTTFLNNLTNEVATVKSEDGTISAREEYKKLINNIASKCGYILEQTNIVPKDLINICYIHFTLDRYLGLIYEYILHQELEYNGFKVYTNDKMDIKNKIDLVVTHPNSSKSIAIQCKSLSYLNKYKSEVANHIKVMNVFKDRAYKLYIPADNIQEVDIKYMVHDEEGYRTIKDKSLIDVDIMINKHIAFDKSDLDMGIFKPDYNTKPIFSIIKEVGEALGVEYSII